MPQNDQVDKHNLKLGKKGDYRLINERGDQFPIERGVTLLAMKLMAQSMKFRVPGEYAVLDARTLQVVYNTIGEGALPDPEPTPDLIGPKAKVGREILRQAKFKLGR